ncbi:hypothetical protein [Brevibacillus sp. H7]|uniref:hypothetical protein n=1 Tax=Brevibacillus sp. H7 TaxID=3349138 RepID=UPI00380AF0C0
MDEKDDTFAVLNKTREIHRQVFGLTHFMNDGCVDFRVPIEKIYVYFIVQILFRMPPPSSGTTRTSNRLMFSCSSRYDHDSTFPFKPFPGFHRVKGMYRENTPQEAYLFAKTFFVRQRNRFVNEIKALIREMDYHLH